MTETDKKIAACVDQIKHDIDRLAELATGEDFDIELLEDCIIEINNHLTVCKQRLTIEYGGLTLTKYPEKLTPGGVRPVICIETGKIYESMAQAGHDTDINPGNISLVVRGINQTAGGYHWEAYEPTEKLKGTSRRSRLTKVICVETGEIFESIAAAGRAYKLNPHNIGNAVRGTIKKSGGFHWRKYEDSTTEPLKQEGRISALELIDWTNNKKDSE